MRRASLLAIVAASLVGLGACGEDQHDSAPAPSEEQPAPDSGSAGGLGGFTGRSASTYTDSKRVCGAFPPAGFARELGIQVDTSTSNGIVRIAEEYAKGYRGEVSQAAFEGCLDGLPNPTP